MFNFFCLNEIVKKLVHNYKISNLNLKYDIEFININIY